MANTKYLKNAQIIFYFATHKNFSQNQTLKHTTKLNVCSLHWKDVISFNAVEKVERCSLDDEVIRGSEERAFSRSRWTSRLGWGTTQASVSFDSMMNPKVEHRDQNWSLCGRSFPGNCDFVAIGDWFNDGEEWSSVKLLGKSNELGRSGIAKNGIFEGIVSEEVLLVVVVSALIGVGVSGVTFSGSDRTEETCNGAGFRMVNRVREWRPAWVEFSGEVINDCKHVDREEAV
jgi:hypothetical protein